MPTNTYTDPVLTTELREWIQNDTEPYVPNECSTPPWNKGFTNWHEGKDNPFYGKKHSLEARKKIGEKNKGKNTGPRSEEIKKKISEGMKRRWASLDK